MRVIRSIRVMESEAELRNWLRVVVNSCAYDRLRKEKRIRIREEEAAIGQRESNREWESRLAWLHAQLETLDAKSYPLIVLRFRFGWTLERIGGLLGLKAGAVDGRIRRAAQELRQKAAEEHDD